jgi:hypothetical protein
VAGTVIIDFRRGMQRLATPSAEGAQVSTERPPSSEGTPARSQPTIFISYRRQDSAWAASKLHEDLAQQFGEDHVFIDVIDLLPGDDFVAELERRVVGCNVFLAVIGPDWARIMREREQLGVANGQVDHVRVEVETALQRGSSIQVIPVLVDETAMPDDRILPRSLGRLARLNSAPYRRTQADLDVNELVRRIQEYSPDGSRDAVPDDPPGPPPTDPHYGVVGDALVEGNVIVVLGSLVNASERTDPWHEGSDSLPDGDELAAYLATEFKYGVEAADLAQVSQYVSSVRGERDLYDALRRIFTAHHAPNRVHRFLAELPNLLAPVSRQSGQLIVTTNYDDALERAFDTIGVPYDIAVYMATGRDRGKFSHLPWDGAWVSKRDCENWTDKQPITITIPNLYESFPIDVVDGTVHRTTIVKVHGAVTALTGDDNYVITENDYIDYLSSNEIVSLIPNQLLFKMRRSHVLFLGQQVRDWNWRVLLQRVWEGHIDNSWAVAPSFDSVEERFWHKLDVYALQRPLSTYVDELRAQLVASRTAAGP